MPSFDSFHQLPLEAHLDEIRASNPDLKRVPTKSWYCHNDNGYGSRLGEALLHNNVVVDLSIGFTHLATKDVSWKIYIDKDMSMDTKVALLTSDLSPLLTYLGGTSCSLQKVALHGGTFPVDDVYATVLLRAISKNPNPLWLSVQSSLPSQALLEFLRTAQSVNRLDVRFVRGQTHDADYVRDASRLALAIAAMKSLETLTFDDIWTDSDRTVVDAVLLALREASHISSKLQSLELRLFNSASSVPQELPGLMQCTATKLKTLQIFGLCLAPEPLGPFGSALGICHIPTLTLPNCTFGKTAQLGLQELLQSTNATGGVNDVHLCARQSWETPVVPSIVAPPFQSRLRIRSFQLSVKDLPQLQTIASALPKSVYLRSLTLDVTCLKRFCQASLATPGIPLEIVATPHSAGVLQQLLDGLRRNGSLQELIVEMRERGGEEHSHLLLPQQMALKRDAYLERNQQLPQLLSNPGGGQCRPSPAVSAIDAATPLPLPTPSHSHLYPTLLVVALSADQMSPTMSLIGLLSTSDGELWFGPTILHADDATDSSAFPTLEGRSTR
jgi:hypothetical protein